MESFSNNSAAEFLKQQHSLPSSTFTVSEREDSRNAFGSSQNSNVLLEEKLNTVSPTRRRGTREEKVEKQGNLSRKDGTGSDLLNASSKQQSSFDFVPHGVGLRQYEPEPLHDGDISAILEEEEALIAAHRKEIENIMEIVREEMKLLAEVDQPGSLIDKSSQLTSSPGKVPASPKRTRDTGSQKGERCITQVYMRTLEELEAGWKVLVQSLFGATFPSIPLAPDKSWQKDVLKMSLHHPEEDALPTFPDIEAFSSIEKKLGLSLDTIFQMSMQEGLNARRFKKLYAVKEDVLANEKVVNERFFRGGRGPLRVVNEKVVGINLGTTNLAITAMEEGKPTIVTYAEGQRITHSVVAYTKNGDRLVDQIDKRQVVVNPENTFFSVKRFIGRKMNEVDEESK
ncbi:hypothetical protein GIB67_008733 [Kingdonia uniflora]|uniref:Uncharacterized protein n=1 Tax=Kingdonia uniflora TaxID=39325 RepID=A0A7J7P679_9MAGN|nr:hypothetical protein GIB67_008733 [Kingdonia uniflora]